MYYTTLNICALAALVVGASAATHQVEVGKGGLTYNPDTITADKGDIVEFHFDSMHSVVAGDFENPCTPVTSGGFYSGVLPMGDKSFFSITINDTDPIFFYCAIEGHCQGGMVGVINQGSDTLSAYKSGAEKTEKSTHPAAEFGGTVGDSSDTGSQSTGSSSKTSGTSSATSAGSASPSSTSGSSAAKHVTCPISGLTCLALIAGGIFVL